MSKPKFTRSRIWEILRSRAALAARETVKLRNLGSLDVWERVEHLARNPRIGEAVIMPPRRCVLFRPGSELKAALRDRPRRRKNRLRDLLQNACRPTYQYRYEVYP
jgi:nucleoid DNA-binding protein